MTPLTTGQVEVLRRVRRAGEHGLRIHGSGITVRNRTPLMAGGYIRVDEVFKKIFLTRLGEEFLAIMEK